MALGGGAGPGPGPGPPGGRRGAAGGPWRGRGRGAAAARALRALAACGTAALARAQLSEPLARDGAGGVFSKFTAREASLDAPPGAGGGARAGAGGGSSDEFGLPGQSDCPADLDLKWAAEAGSSVYATPRVADLFHDGRSDLLVPGFVGALEALEGSRGARLPGWPASHHSTAHTSPLMYDIDFDGVEEAVLATYNGEVLFFADTGRELRQHRLTVPRLRVRRDWYEGLLPDHTDHSRADVGDGDGRPRRPRPEADDARTGPAGRPEGGGHGGGHGAGRRRGLRATQEAPSVEADPAAGEITEAGERSFEEVFGDDFRVEDDDEDRGGAPGGAAGGAGGGGAEGASGGAGSFFDVDDDEDYGEDRPDFGWGQHAGSDWDPDNYWEDDDFAPHRNDDTYVFLDAHILCTPAIADLDGDGRDELVVGVSYFFDKDYYEDPERKAELGVDLDISKYVASGVVVYDLTSRAVKASTHLDLTTDSIRNRAYVYSSPTLADLDGDGKLEVALGTSVGFVYVLDHQLETLSGWPLLMGEVQAQVTAADVDGDGALELVACDTHGNVAAFRADRTEVWERHTHSMITQGATVGDVDGDGELEVVVGTASGNVHVLRGRDGTPKPGFPFRAGGKVMAPVLVTPVGGDGGGHQQLVFPAFDGLLYVVDGATACADTLYLGERSYAMPLAEDMDGDGLMDLVVVTMNGGVFCFGTREPHHPLKTWPAHVQAANGLTARHNFQGIFALPDSRRPRDVGGETLRVQFEIVDRRAQARAQAGGGEAGGASEGAPAAYNVTVKLVGVGVDEMKGGERPVIGVADAFARPGVYTVEIPCPKTRTTAGVRLEMATAGGLRFEDNFSVSFHVHYYRLLKWMVALPFTFMVAGVLALLPGLQPDFPGAPAGPPGAPGGAVLPP